MTFSVPNRQTMRDRMVTLITAQITTYVSVYDHIPRTFDGESPVCTVSNVGSARQDHPYHYTFRFLVGSWVRRDLGTAASEDTLDALAGDLFQFELDNRADATLQRLKLDLNSFTRADYIVVDGIEYRVEFFTFDNRPQTIVS